jgi:hypothetical protein
VISLENGICQQEGKPFWPSMVFFKKRALYSEWVEEFYSEFTYDMPLGSDKHHICQIKNLTKIDRVQGEPEKLTWAI